MIWKRYKESCMSLPLSRFSFAMCFFNFFFCFNFLWSLLKGRNFAEKSILIGLEEDKTKGLSQVNDFDLCHS